MLLTLTEKDNRNLRKLRIFRLKREDQENVKVIKLLVLYTGWTEASVFIYISFTIIQTVPRRDADILESE